VEEGLLGSWLAGNWSSSRLPKGAGGRLGAAGRAGACRGQGQWLPFKATCGPPTVLRTDGGHLGNAHARRRRTDRWSVACTHGGSVLEVFPTCKASEGELRPWEGARRPRKARRRDRTPRRRQPAARPGSGAALFKPVHFERVFLLKIEYKCTKR
jgi:hypothetical protein